MTSHERLNVLLSRARDALILIGDAETFIGSRKSGGLWQRFMGMLKDGNHIYDGFPVKCERHTDRTALLRCPEEFDKDCPDGGCTEPWLVLDPIIKHMLMKSIQWHDAKLWPTPVSPALSPAVRPLKNGL